MNNINFCKYLYSVYTSAMINICFLRVLQFALEVPGYIERIQMETKDCSLSSSLCCLLLTKPLRSNCNCHPCQHYPKIDPYFDLEKLLKLREKIIWFWHSYCSTVALLSPQSRYKVIRFWRLHEFLVIFQQRISVCRHLCGKCKWV